MAVLSITASSVSSFPRFQALMVAAVQRIRLVRVAFANRRAVHGLYGYDERMLKDIGLVSSDLDAALNCGLTEDPSRHLASVAAGRGRKRI